MFNQKLRTKINQLVTKTVSSKAAKSVMKQIDSDLILPMLPLTSKTKISVDVDEKYLYVNIGPRDFEFYINSGRLMGAGTLLSGV